MSLTVTSRLVTAALTTTMRTGRRFGIRLGLSSSPENFTCGGWSPVNTTATVCGRTETICSSSWGSLARRWPSALSVDERDWRWPGRPGVFARVGVARRPRARR
jgi:hypothetical protein